MMDPSHTTSAANGPPNPARTFSSDSSIALCMNRSTIRVYRNAVTVTLFPEPATLHTNERRVVIAGIGIDVAEVERIREAIERHGRRFIDRIYTPAEIAYV